MSTQKKVTSDIYLAAALLALGAKLGSTDKTDPRHMQFTLELELPESVPLDMAKNSLMDLDYLETQWANNSLMVNAVQMADAIKRLKSVVHSR